MGEEKKPNITSNKTQLVECQVEEKRQTKTARFELSNSNSNNNSINNKTKNKHNNSNNNNICCQTKTTSEKCAERTNRNKLLNINNQWEKISITKHLLFKRSFYFMHDFVLLCYYLHAGDSTARLSFGPILHLFSQHVSLAVATSTGFYLNRSFRISCGETTVSLSFFHSHVCSLTLCVCVCLY